MLKLLKTNELGKKYLQHFPFHPLPQSHHSCSPTCGGNPQDQTPHQLLHCTAPTQRTAMSIHRTRHYISCFIEQLLYREQQCQSTGPDTTLAASLYSSYTENSDVNPQDQTPHQLLHCTAPTQRTAMSIHRTRHYISCFIEQLLHREQQCQSPGPDTTPAAALYSS